eukprot:1145290-Pelagomonas_calceolata.AAC.2
MAHAHAKVHPFNEAWSSSGEGHDDEEDMDLKQQESTARKLRANSCLHGSGSGNSYTYDRPELPYTAASRSRKSVVLRDLLEQGHLQMIPRRTGSSQEFSKTHLLIVSKKMSIAAVYLVVVSAV